MKSHLKKPDFGEYAKLFEIFEGIYGRLKFSPDPFLLLETSIFRCITSHPIIHTEALTLEKKEMKVSPILPKKEEKNT